MNWYGIKAIYIHEMERFRRTLFQSLASPIITTSLYFVVFGSAIGSHMIKFAGDSVNRLTLVGYNRTGNMPFKRPKMLSWRAAKTEEELNTAQRHNLSVMMIHKQEKIDDMADTLFTKFKELNYKKIILKRPIKGEKICNNINYQIKGKSTRFDIYI